MRLGSRVAALTASLEAACEEVVALEEGARAGATEAQLCFMAAEDAGAKAPMAAQGAGAARAAELEAALAATRDAADAALEVARRVHEADVRELSAAS